MNVTQEDIVAGDATFNTSDTVPHISPTASETTDNKTVHESIDIEPQPLEEQSGHVYANNNKQLLQPVHSNTTADAVLDSLKNLEISPKQAAMSDKQNSSHAAVMQQLQQIRRMPLSPTGSGGGGINMESTILSELRNNKESTKPTVAVVTSVSQYELTQSHQTVRMTK